MRAPVTDPMDVLFAIPELDRGGPDRVMFELISALDRRRFRPRVVVSEPRGHFLSRLPADVAVEVLARSTGLRHRYPVLQMLQHVRRTRPDVVFGTGRMTFTLGVASLAFPSATKVVLRQANDVTADFAELIKQSPIKHRVSYRLALATLRRADAIVCQSQAMRTDLARLLGREAALHVIGNPIDVDVVDRAVRDNALPLRGRPALVSVGRLMAQKGYDLLLAAIARLVPSHPDLHLTIVGEGPDRAKLEAQIADLGLGQHVTLAGYSNEPLRLVRGSDLFVLTSRYEGFPNAALEALACGTPIVLTDCPGANAELVRAGANGRIAPSLRIDDIALALDLAIRERHSYSRAQIQDDCRARFATQHIVARYERVLDAVTGRASRAAA